MGFFTDEEVAAIYGGRRPPSPRDYRLPTAFPSLNKAKRICLDLESHDPSLGDGKGPGWRRGAYIVGFGLAIVDRKGVCEFSEYYPLRHKGVQNLNAERVWEWITTETAFYTGEITGANLLYDFDGFQYQDLYAPLAKFRDVQWAEALLDENAMSYKLNALSLKYLGIPKVTDLLKQLYGPGYIERFEEIHPGHARDYVLGDIHQPLQVLNEQMKQLRKEDLEELFFLESRLLPMLLYMRRLGVRVDLNKAAKMSGELIKVRDQAIGDIATMSGVETNYDNFGKPQLMKAIFDKLGIKYPYLVPDPHKEGETLIIPAPDPNCKDEVLNASVLKKWEEARDGGGKPSFRKLWLDEGLEHPIAELIVKANAAEKARGTFVDGYITDNAIGDRVHCEFHPLRKKADEHTKSKGTITGRFSGANPNLQNIPARDEWIGPMCRSMFIADEGAKWWSQDYSQIEYRMLVHFAVENKCTGAEVPQQMYLKNPKTDFHDACAEMMYKEKWHKAIADFAEGRINKDEMKAIHKALRKPAKNLNFGMVYGMGAPLLAAQLGQTNADGSPNDIATEIMKDYHDAAPYIRELNKICVSEAEKKNFITTILNRRGRFPLWEPKYKEKGKQYEPACPYEEALAKWGPKIHIVGTHKALNKKLQGSAADLMKLAMVIMWEAGIFDPGNDITCVLTVHDELNGSFIPSARGLASRAEVKRIMETCMPLHIPVLTSGETGNNWAEAK
jgi:DNA polymerase I-like protein with 3'-5' exonuclease and polymerase domains